MPGGHHAPDPKGSERPSDEGKTADWLSGGGNMGGGHRSLVEAEDYCTSDVKKGGLDLPD